VSGRVALLPLALLASCVPTPPYYSVPPQHRSGPAEEVVGFGEFILSANPAAEAYYIKDVKGLEGSAWRWTLVEPEFRFFLKTTKDRVFKLDLGINDTTFRDTGPVRLQIVINGELLDEPVFSKPGDYQYEQPVPERMLKASAENRVLVKVLNPWAAPDPGVRLGFLLHGVGFVAK
jgi:hypothetical protein